MKKVLCLVTIVLYCSSITAFAQSPLQTMAERRASILEKIRPLHLTQPQKDSVVNIYTDLKGLIHVPAGSSKETKLAALKANSDVQLRRLDKALGASLAKKVDELIVPSGPHQ